jgi:hypothetical protein
MPEMSRAIVQFTGGNSFAKLWRTFAIVLFLEFGQATGAALYVTASSWTILTMSAWFYG